MFPLTREKEYVEVGKREEELPLFSDDKIEYVRDNLTDVDIYIQLAEEASELSQAASKMARILLGNNPTPITPDSGESNILEEYADVLLCIDALNLNKDEKNSVDKIKSSKLDRWVHRIEEG